MAASDPTELPADVPEDAVDELYGLPLDEFTTRRDALSRDLRNGGKREAAEWVKALRKPSTAAWIVNQLARTRPREKRELLRAGDALRTAHERLVGGQGDAAELRSAADAEHAAAQALLADAGGFLDRAGYSPSASTLEKVAQTIRAVALDEDARAGFQAARLTRERSASGFGPIATAAPSPGRAKTRERAARGKGTKRSGTSDAGPRAREETAKQRAALQQARSAQRERARDVKAAERDLASAEREAERAVQRLERARAEADRARSRLAEAESQLAEAENRRG